MKWPLNIMGLGTMMTALLITCGCESDSAHAADSSIVAAQPVTSPPVVSTVPVMAETPQPASIPSEVAAVDEPLPANLDPNSPVASVIKLAQAGVSESVILSYISNSSAPFNLDSDQIIYLRDLGLSDAMITAMIQRDQALGNVAATPPASESPSPSVVEQAPPTTTVQSVPADVVDYTYFYDSLSPYGSWVEVEGYGRCWQPTVVVINRNWQPYCDNGHWVYTDCGWYWVSDYSWGWAPFHYGRWFRDSRRGWCWVPDSIWGPSWVSWRYNNDYCGWAPLPPAARYHSGIGFTYHGRNVDISFGFGLTSDCYTFVPTARFSDRHPGRYRAPRNQETHIYNNTTVINNIVVGNNNTIINRGLGTERIERATHQTYQPVHIRENNDRDVRGGRHEQFESGNLVVNRPTLNQHAANQGRNIPHFDVPPRNLPGNRNDNRNDRGTPGNRSDRNNTSGNHGPAITADSPERGNNFPANSDSRNQMRDGRPDRNDSNPESKRGNNPPTQNVPRSGNVTTPPPLNRPAPFTPAVQSHSAGNPVVNQNNTPRAVTPPVTSDNPPINNRDNSDRRREENSRPNFGQPSSAPHNPASTPVITPTSPQSQKPVVNTPPTKNERAIRVPDNRSETPRFTSPRVESQIPPPKTTPVIPPTFPRNENRNVNQNSGNTSRSYTAPDNSSSQRSQDRSTQRSQDSGSRSGGGDRRGDNRGNDRRNP